MNKVTFLFIKDTNIQAVASDGAGINRNISEDTAQKVNDAYQECVQAGDDFQWEALMSIIGIEMDMSDLRKASALVKLAQDEDRLFIDGDRLFVKGITQAVPTMVATEMAKTWETKDRKYLEVLLKFWGHTSKHSDAQTREDLYGFMERNGRVMLASNGYLVAFRGSKTIVRRNLELYEAIIVAHATAKAHKKAPSKCGLNSKTLKYCRLPNEDAYNEGENLESLLGRVEDFNGKYTDFYTNKMDLRFGEIVAVPRSEVVDDRTVACTKGLHITGFPQLNKQYYHSRGRTDMSYTAVLVNPAHIMALPVDYGYNKGRCRQYLIVDELDQVNGNPVEPSWYNDTFLELPADIEATLEKQYLAEVKELLAGADKNEVALHDLAFLSLDVDKLDETRYSMLFGLLTSNSKLLDETYIQKRESVVDDDYDYDYEEEEEEEEDDYDGVFWGNAPDDDDEDDY